MNCTGFYENKNSKYGVSYLVFDANGNATSLSGYAAKQFSEYADQLLSNDFTITLEMRHSEQWNRDFPVVTAINKGKSHGGGLVFT